MNHLRFAQIGLLRECFTQVEVALHGHCSAHLADIQGQCMKLGGDEIMLAADFDTYAKATKACIAAFLSMDDARQALDHEINCITHMIRLTPKLKECVEGLRQSPNGLDRALAQCLANEIQDEDEVAPSATANPSRPQSHAKADDEARSGWLSRVALKLSGMFVRPEQEPRPSASLPEASSTNISAEQAAATSDLSSRIAIAAEASRRLDARASKAAISTYRQTKGAAEAAEKVWEVVAIQSATQTREIDKSILGALMTLKETLAHGPMGIDLDWARAVTENIENLESAKAEVDAERIGVRQKLDQARLASSRASAPEVQVIARHEPMSDLPRRSVSQSSPTIALT